jgi:hypothetical protein
MLHNSGAPRCGATLVCLGGGWEFWAALVSGAPRHGFFLLVLKKNKQNDKNLKKINLQDDYVLCGLVVRKINKHEF